MIGIGTERIFGNMHILHPQFPVDKQTIGIGQTGFSFTNGFDFGTEQLNAGDQKVGQLVIKKSAPVFYVDIGGFMHTQR